MVPLSSTYPSLPHFQPTKAHFLKQLEIQTLSSFSSGATPISHDSPLDTSILYHPKSLLKAKRKREHSLTQHCPQTTISPFFPSLAKQRSLPIYYNSKPRKMIISLPLISELPTAILSVNLSKTVGDGFNTYPRDG